LDAREDAARLANRSCFTYALRVFEEHVKDQLDQALRGAGFDAERDIRAITVNRWPHGYACSLGLLWEPEWKSEAEKPWVVGRQPFGRIAIANSDAGAGRHEQRDHAGVPGGPGSAERLRSAPRGRGCARGRFAGWVTISALLILAVLLLSAGPAAGTSSRAASP
jgi:hypothetical protein